MNFIRTLKKILTFLKLIITQDDQETKLGYVKYIPDFEIPYINPSSFTGSIQMLNIDMEIVTENYFINGVLQPSASSSTAAKGIDGCTSTTVIITHNCTNGDNHAPGEPCGTKKNPLVNDGYYEIKITVFCPGDDPMAEVPEVFIDIAGPSGGATPANSVDPNIALAAVRFKLYNELTRSQRLWWDNTNNSALKNDLINYLNENSFVLVNDLLDGEALAFTLQLIEQARLNSTLNFDVNASANSPANIDRSAIDNNTPEGQKFYEIYNELAKVPEFKDIFVDVFDSDGTRPNVKFVIEEHVYRLDNPNNTEVNATTNGNNPNFYLIKINKQCLIPNGTKKQAHIEIAKTIAHEAMHAYLYFNINNPVFANISMPDLLDELKNIDANQHNFIFTNLAPKLGAILSQLKDILTTPAQRAVVENNIPMYAVQSPQSVPISWNWNTYFTYLRYQGLEQSEGFKALFPEGSDAFYIYKQYMNDGHFNL